MTLSQSLTVLPRTLPSVQHPQLKHLVVAVAACYAGTLSALPTMPSVAAGQAAISVQGKTLNVVNTPGTVINWQGFSIAADEAARFQQQSAASSVLNRVTGQDPSAILGKLQSNGRVFVINPNGIVFGPGAQIDVAGLVASSLHMSNADFLGGRLQFREQGSAGAVVNQGEIRTPLGGQVYLVAPRVENHGIITTPGGDIVLAAGRKVEIVDAKNPSIRIEVVAPENEALNIGKLVAAGGSINMAGGVLRISGKVSADAAVMENGKVAFRRTATPPAQDIAGSVTLKASAAITLEPGAVVSADGPVAGTVTLHSDGDLSLQIESRVSASGAVGGAVSARAETGTLIAQGTVETIGEGGPGGTIRLQGNRVALLQRSRTDASGSEGGGTVLVGGGFQGHDPSTQNALKTIVAPDAEIRADATVEGDGGTVVVWSDESTRYHGGISAKGAGAGKGGFVEVSGKKYLDFAGRVDVSASSGRAGTLLLDPDNITLTIADANTAGFTPPGDTEQWFSEDAGLNSTFNVNAGGSFAGITAGSNIVLQAVNNITVASAFNVAAATGGNTNINVTLQANNSIAMNAAITTAGTGSITLIADNNQDGTGAITRTAAGTLNTGAGGSVTLSAGSGLNAAVSTPTLTVSNSTGGAVTVSNANTGGGASFGNVVASALSVTTTNGAVTQTGNITVTGTTTFALGNAGDATLASTGNDFANVTVTNARNVTLRDTNALAFAGVSTVRGNLSVTAGGAVTQTGSMNASLGTATFNIGTANDLTLANTTNAFANVSIVSAGNATLYEAGGFDLGATTVTNNLTVTSTGGITSSGNIVVPGRLTVETRNAGVASITFNSAGNNFGSVSAQALNVAGNAASSGVITLRENSAMDLALLTTTGNGALTANGAITQSGVMTVGGTLTANAGSGNDITLTNATNNFGTVAITQARDATLVDVNTMNVGAGTVSGNLTVTANGALGFSGLLSAGNLTVTMTNGAVTQSAALTVSGTANLQAGTGNVTLGSANNFNVLDLAAQTASVTDANALTLGNVVTTGNLTLASGVGGLNQTAGGTVTVGGTANFTAGATNNITLTNATNNFNVVRINTGNNVQIRDMNELSFGGGTSTVSGVLTVTANGAVTQASNLAVTGLATFNIGTANDLTLNLPTNNFGTVAIINAANATIVDTDPITLNASTVSGALNVTVTNNTLTVAGNISTAAANGAISFNAGTGQYVQAANMDVASGSGNITISANTMNINTNTGNNAFQTSGMLTLRPGTTTQAMSLGGASAFDITATEINAFMPGLNNAGGSLAIGRSDSTAVMTIGAAQNFGTGSRVMLTAGSITDGNAVVALTADTLTLYANNGNIGAAGGNNAIDVSASNLVVGTNNQSAFIRSATGLNFGPATSNLGSGSLNATAAAGNITQSGAIVATGNVTTFNAGTSSVTLGNTANDFGTVSITAANTVTLADANAISVNVPVVSGGVGISAGGNATITSTGTLVLRASTVIGTLNVTANGAVSQTGAVTVSGAASFNAGSNALTMNHASNDFSSVQVVAAGNTAITDANTLSLAGVNGNGTLALKTTGALTQTAALVASGLVTLDVGGTGNATLTHASNNFARVTVTAANNVSLVDTNAIDLGAFSVNGAISAVAGGNVTLSGALSAAGAGNAIVIAAGGNFLNTAGAAALSTTSGRWLVYSADPALNTFGGLASSNGGLWSHTYAGNAPASISQTGNRYLFTSGRVLTVAAANFSKTYGDDVTAALGSSYTVAGLNTNTHGGALVADAAAGVLNGTPTITSAGATSTAGVAGSPYAIAIGAGTLSPQNGYTLTVGAGAQLSVTPASLTVGVEDASRLQGAANPAFSPTYSGFKGTDGTGTLAGTLQYSTTASPNSAPGNYAVTPFGVTAANYSVVFRQGTLRVESTYRQDPLQSVYGAFYGLTTAGLYDLQNSPRAPQPGFVFADASVSLEDFLSRLPASAADGIAANRAACSAGAPILLLRCRN